MAANDKQISGEHYKAPIQCWDFIASNNLDFFQGSIVKYVTRFRTKGGKRDLEKAIHFLEKLIELDYGKDDESDVWVSANEIREEIERLKSPENGQKVPPTEDTQHTYVFGDYESSDRCRVCGKWSSDKIHKISGKEK